jgi:hypothetical protein
MGQAGLADAAFAIDHDMDALFFHGIDQRRHRLAAAGKGFARDHRLRCAQRVAQGQPTAGQLIGRIGFHVVRRAGDEARQHRRRFDLPAAMSRRRWCWRPACPASRVRAARFSPERLPSVSLSACSLGLPAPQIRSSARLPHLRVLRFQIISTLLSSLRHYQLRHRRATKAGQHAAQTQAADVPRTAPRKRGAIRSKARPHGQKTSPHPGRMVAAAANSV